MHRHVVTEEGTVFAAALAGDVVEYAIEVDDPQQHLLDQQVEEAKFAYDSGQAALCSILTDKLLYGEATTIGAYFEVGI